MFSTYNLEDVTILLKDISGLVKPQSTEVRERLIQSGRHYSEMLPIEYEPSPAYLKTYYIALERYSAITAEAVGNVADWIYSDKGKDVVLVSLARAGTSIGILIKHYIEQKYHCKIKHYTISIIRGIGIDKNAMNYILKRHEPQSIQFVDGWTGKGAIQNQLVEAMKDYPVVDSGLAVLSDPAHIADKYGTHEDFLIASSCLNSIVSGLLSRTFLRNDIIDKDDFHGAAFYSNLKDKDLTYQFINAIESKFNFLKIYKNKTAVKDNSGLDEVFKIADEFHICDINLIKPSIGEATRVLLRRLPWKILVHSLSDEEHLGHLYQLAKEKKVELIEYQLQNYKACGLIRSLADT
ncbi:MAG: cysteine protease StiP family protein [Selenomonadaceae bacterium]|nr:cysteine protease StiP family protein [Selenomonadaceae bacterium]